MLANFSLGDHFRKLNIDVKVRGLIRERVNANTDFKH